ncbi:MAG: lipid-A-disaccharide synthase [Amylibacter sp.]|tara:strand:+ start:1140 stop:2309 length:1170 start_codon:yes stop_codon:yes gene_type:complete
MSNLKFFIIAGEMSGDILGASLMSGLITETKGKVSFYGVGGPLMTDVGLNSMFNMSDLSVMGVFEVIPKIPMLLSRIKKTARAVIDEQPDALITIDSPDFCLRVAKIVRLALPKIKIIHYVAPSVWAWRPERAFKMAKNIDHVLALLPFEPPYMEDAGMTCDFVGHPVISNAIVKPKAIEKLRANLELHAGPIITVLPGSRIGEIKRMCPIFKDVLINIKEKIPDVQFILPAASTVEDLVISTVKNWEVKPKLLLSMDYSVLEISNRKYAAYAVSSAALATSGTVALELASQNCPMVVAYKANWITTKMVEKLAKIDTANLINIITDTRKIPEHLFDNCTAENISKSLCNLLLNGGKQDNVMAEAMDLLGFGNKDSHLWAAKSVLRAIQ